MGKGFDHIGLAVVTFCHDGEGKYLVGKRSDMCRDEQGHWEPVGSGGVELHETLEDAVRREVREESGAEARDIEFMGYREVFRIIDGVKSHWIAFDFKARIDSVKASIQEPHKCTAFTWCTPDEIPEPRHSQFSAFLEKYQHLF